MYCVSCGTENDDSANFCKSCGKAMDGMAPGARRFQAGSVEAPRHVPNYLVQAILVTIFCCMPFGIVSIVYAAQVNGKLATGDTAGALQSSQSAKTWAWVSLGVGLALSGIGLLVWVLTIVGAVVGA